MLDTNGICERSNPALQAFFGRTGRELLDAPIFEWLHPDDMAGTTKSFDTLKGTGKPIIRYVNRCRIAAGSLTEPIVRCPGSWCPSGGGTIARAAT